MQDPRHEPPGSSLRWLHSVPPIGARLALGPGEVHVWHADSDAARDPALLAAYEALLTADERARYQRYLHAGARHLYLVTRALVRTTLSRYAPVAPAEWRFAEGERGKPYVVGEAAAHGLCFNLSNTEGLVACAVTRAGDVGVDVENTTRASDLLEIADRFFAPAEVRGLAAVPADRRRERFFSYWTLKEAYIKARGLGLAIPLELFAFELDGPDIGIALDPRLGDDPVRWRFALFRATERHLLALAVRSSEAIALRQAACVPLVSPR